MKKFILCIATALSLVAISPLQLTAGVEITSVPVETTPTPESIKAKVLTTRLEQIDAMDKQNMSPGEKRALRKEVKTIKKDLKEMSGGVYLSVGAVIIIILLLILLL